MAFGVANAEMTWADAMGLVVLEGIIILVLVLTGFRQAVFHAVPTQLKTAISVGIGLFITFIGLVDAGFVRTPAGAATPVELGIGGYLTAGRCWSSSSACCHDRACWSRAGPAARSSSASSATTIVAIVVEAIANVGAQTVDGKWSTRTAGGSTSRSCPTTLRRHPGLRRCSGHFSLFGGVQQDRRRRGAACSIFTLMLADFFDTMGTMSAIGAEAGLLDEEGNPPNAQRILHRRLGRRRGRWRGQRQQQHVVHRVRLGRRRGRPDRPGLAWSPACCSCSRRSSRRWCTVVPYEAATPALVVVGFLMMQQVRDIDWDDLEIAIPAFLTIVLMPFTYSITVGIGAGLRRLRADQGRPRQGRRRSTR